jgi:hypothetical protein
MGAMKELMLEREAMEPIAAEIAVVAGAVKLCPLHDHVLIDQYDDEALVDAYKIANAQITRGEIKLPDSISRTDFSAMINKLVEESGSDCYECEHIFNKDD